MNKHWNDYLIQTLAGLTVIAIGGVIAYFWSDELIRAVAILVLVLIIIIALLVSPAIRRMLYNPLSWLGEKLTLIMQSVIAHWKPIATLATLIFEAVVVYLTPNPILELVITITSSLLIFSLTRSYYLSLQQSKLTYHFLFTFLSGVAFTFAVAQFINIDLSRNQFLPSNTPTPTVSELLRVNPDKFAEIMFVIDTSDSYSLPRIKVVVKTLVEKLLPNDRIGLISYNTDEIKTILPITPIGKTGDELFLVKLHDLGSYRNGIYPLFYDAIMFSTSEIEFQRNDYKSVIIFVNGYRSQPSEANYQVEDVLTSIERSAKNGTVVIPISLGSNDSDLIRLIASAADTEAYESYDLFWINDLINKYLQ